MDMNQNLGQIECGGLGAHKDWDRNTAKANRDGLERCNHCGKGMTEGTGFKAVWFWKNDCFYPLTVKEEVLAAGGEMVNLGVHCVKQFANKDEFNTYFEKR